MGDELDRWPSIGLAADTGDIVLRPSGMGVAVAGGGVGSRCPYEFSGGNWCDRPA